MAGITRQLKSERSKNSFHQLTGLCVLPLLQSMPDGNVCYYLNSQYHNYYITENCYVYIISKKMVDRGFVYSIPGTTNINSVLFSSKVINGAFPVRPINHTCRQITQYSKQNVNCQCK